MCQVSFNRFGKQMIALELVHVSKKGSTQPLGQLFYCQLGQGPFAAFLDFFRGIILWIPIHNCTLRAIHVTIKHEVTLQAF